MAATGAQVVQVSGDARRRGDAESLEHGRVRGAQRRAAGARDAQRSSLRRALRAQQRQRRRHGRAGGLGRRPALGGFPATGGATVGIVDTGIDANHEDLSGKVVACAQPSQLLTNAVREGSCTDDERPRHARRRHDRGEGQQRPRRRGRLVQLEPGDLQGAQRRSARARRRASRTASPTSLSKGVKVISMSLGGGASTTLQTAVTQRVEQRQRLADHRRGRQRRQRDGQLPGRLRRGRLASRRPTATTSARRSRTRTPTSRSRPPASTSSRPSAAAATSRSRARRWRRRTSPAWRR